MLVAGRAVTNISIGVYAGSTNKTIIYNFVEVKSSYGVDLSVNGLTIGVKTESGTLDGFLIVVK